MLRGPSVGWLRRCPRTSAPTWFAGGMAVASAHENGGSRLGPEIEEMISRRRAWGADRFDEVWEGEYHMAPFTTAAHSLVSARLSVVLHPFAEASGLIGTAAFNLGEPADYRVPDLGYHREFTDACGVPTAAVVV